MANMEKVVVQIVVLTDGKDCVWFGDANNDANLDKLIRLRMDSRGETEHRCSTIEARALLEQKKKNGEPTSCALCDQEVKVYPRPLNGIMSKILVLIYRYFKDADRQEWLHVDEHLKKFGINCRYYSLLRFWGLIEAMPGKRGDGSARTGFWKITPRGVAFVEKQVMVPQYFHMFNQDIYRTLGENGFSREMIGIDEALKSGGFDYNEMMAMDTFGARAAAA